MLVLQGTVIVGGLYYWKHVVQALVVQAVMLPLNLYETGLFKVHLLGQPATGPLARPFKEDNPFAAYVAGPCCIPLPRSFMLVAAGAGPPACDWSACSITTCLMRLSALPLTT